MIEQIRPLITATEPNELAREINAAYRYVKDQLLPNRRVEKYEDSDDEKYGSFQHQIDLTDPTQFDRCYKNMQAVRNSTVSKVGTLCNNLLLHALTNLGLEVQPEYSLEYGTKRRNIDLFVPKTGSYISVTTTPRERKRGDWRNELDLLVSKSRDGRIENWGFTGFMYEGSSVKEAPRIEKELQRVWQSAQVINAQDEKNLAIWLATVAGHKW